MATYKVNKDGKAQSGLKAGDVVVTGGGTYTITGVNADGSYKSTLSDKSTTTNNYKGSYASTASGSSGSSGSIGGTGGSGRTGSTGNSGSIGGSGSSGGSGYYSPTGGNSGGSGAYVPKGNWEGDRMQTQAVQDQLKVYQDQFYAAQQAGDQQAMNAAHAAAEALRRQYGYSGGTDGSEYLPFGQTGTLGDFSYGSAPSYSDSYSPRIDAMLDKILNRDDFDYDALKDPLYAQYKDQYLRQGHRAMLDTLGQASARTGGLASSYATTASQQANQYYAQQLADKVPELYQLAYEMYLQDIEGQVRDLGLLQGVSDTQYGRYRDTVSDWYNDRNFAYNQYRDDVADDRYANEWDYGVGRDEKNDARVDQTQAYERALDLLQAGIMPGQDVLRQAGLSQQEAGTLLAGRTAGYSGGGSGGTGGGSGAGGTSAGAGTQDYDGLYAAARASGNAKSFIANNYKRYGFTSATGLYDDYSVWSKDLEGTRWSDYSRELLYAAQHETMPKEILDQSIQMALEEGRISEDEATRLYAIMGL